MTDFIGKGWRFPIKVNAKGGLSWSEGLDRIQDAIWLIIKTGLGERVMRPQFGAGVDDYVFQPNSPTIRAALAAAIQSALLQWEPRIDLEAVRVDPVPGEPSQVLASIEYTIRSTNEMFNVVYPLYLEEGVS
jgi:phage baseplate assembly protein W